MIADEPLTMPLC